MAWEELFRGYAEFYSTSVSDTVLEEVFSWLSDPDHPVSGHVAVVDDVVVGFAHLHRQFNTFRAGPSWVLDDLYVTPEIRGGGVGRALISHVSDYAHSHGGGRIRWITAENNTRARQLYDTLSTKTNWVVYEMTAGDTP